MNKNRGTITRPKNIEELREQLLDGFDWVKTNPKKINQVKEMTNCAGRILGTLKAQMEYSIMRGEEPIIAFMGKTSGKALSAATQRKLLS